MPKKYLLTETCERETVMTGDYDNLKAANEAMAESFLEHAMNYYGGKTEDYNILAEKIKNLPEGETYEDDECGFYVYSAWSNLDDDNLSDWNIHEIDYPDAPPGRYILIKAEIVPDNIMDIDQNYIGAYIHIEDAFEAMKADMIDTLRDIFDNDDGFKAIEAKLLNCNNTSDLSEDFDDIWLDTTGAGIAVSETPIRYKIVDTMKNDGDA